MSYSVKVSAVLVFLSILLSAPLRAGEWAGHGCEAVAQTQQEMNRQAEDDYRKSDAELNAVYRELMTHLSGEQKKALVEAELAWIRFRDSNCACWALVHKGGSLYPLMYFGYMKSMTDERTAQLKAMKRDMLIDEQR
jgi:uncharacterized protein YecT (DUF1311 family)